MEPKALPPQSPNLNACAERFVRAVKEQCLSKFIPFPKPEIQNINPHGRIIRETRLGELVNYYCQKPLKSNEDNKKVAI
jgi:hypothetical protein